MMKSKPELQESALPFPTVDSNDNKDCDDVDTYSSSTKAKEEDEERDEIKEVRKLAENDTLRVRMWRFAVTGALLVTGTAVTWKTYDFLKLEQYNNFEVAVSFDRCCGASGPVATFDRQWQALYLLIDMGNIAHSLSGPYSASLHYKSSISSRGL